ncbi:MAG: hypothetical protein ACI8UO_004179 [Verrucomicrobiales bacterium]|jgi:hypothetical protein
MAGGETKAHRQLKAAAFVWAQQSGYSAVGLEIRTPASKFRADAAACKPPKNGEPGLTAVFECKQSRADFLKDRHALDENRERLAELTARREKLERQLGVHHPSLRAGDALFQEFESVDLSSLQHAGYQQLLRELNQIQNRIFGKTKFDRMVRWRCADLFYLVVPDGLVELSELPESWGLLTADLDLESEDGLPLKLERKPRFVDAPVERRLELLHRIAVSGARFRIASED